MTNFFLFDNVKVPCMLGWLSNGGERHHWVARIGGESGVTFAMGYYPSCHRRGPFRLMLAIDDGPDHHRWGCFDYADQPLRYYHKVESAVAEADAIAKVLLDDFAKARPAKKSKPTV